jgi:hypothetical protein
MKVEVSVRGPLRDVGREAHRLEAASYHRIWSAESSHGPFPAATLAAAATSQVFEADDELWAQVREGFSAQQCSARIR